MEINSALSHLLQLLEAAPLEYTGILCSELLHDQAGRGYRCPQSYVCYLIQAIIITITSN